MDVRTLNGIECDTTEALAFNGPTPTGVTREQVHRPESSRTTTSRKGKNGDNPGGPSIVKVLSRAEVTKERTPGGS